MKITVGKLSIEKNGVEAKWDGMTIEGTVEETVEGYKYMLRMLPEAKEMFMSSLEEVKAYQAEERKMRLESHKMDLALERVRHENRMQEMAFANEFNKVEVDSVGISDDEWSEDDDDEDLEPVDRAYKQTRGMRFENPREGTEKDPTKKAKKSKK